MTSPAPSAAVMCVADQGHTEVVRLLLDTGANPDFANRDGSTALDLAYERPRWSRRWAVGRLLSSRDAAGKGYVLGLRTPQFWWDVGAIGLSAGYLGAATYLELGPYDLKTEDNPFRFVSYGLLVGTGTVITGILLFGPRCDNPWAELGRGMALMYVGAATVAYGVAGLLLIDNPYAYFVSAAMVSSLPLLTLEF
ncbi:MAG: hypothetical protein JW940_22210 [Polyangiaceae bacterium]|nr:hypothetical protein [Polyangiaceae bacterium]